MSAIDSFLAALLAALLIRLPATFLLIAVRYVLAHVFGSTLNIPFMLDRIIYGVVLIAYLCLFRPYDLLLVSARHSGVVLVCLVEFFLLEGWLAVLRAGVRWWATYA